MDESEAINHANVAATKDELTSSTRASSARSSVVKELKLERSQANLKKCTEGTWMSTPPRKAKNKAAWQTDGDFVTTGPLVAPPSTTSSAHEIDCLDALGSVSASGSVADDDAEEDDDDGDDEDDDDEGLESARALYSSGTQGAQAMLKRFENVNEWGYTVRDKVSWGSTRERTCSSGRRRHSRALTYKDRLEVEDMGGGRSRRRARSVSPGAQGASQNPWRQVRLGSSSSWIDGTRLSPPGIWNSGEDWPTVEVSECDEDEDASSMSKCARRRSGAKLGNNPSLLLSMLLEELDEWDFDIFLIEELAPIGSMHIVGFAVLERHMMLETFDMDEKVLNSFLRKVQSMYPPNPYHNSIHAADGKWCVCVFFFFFLPYVLSVSKNSLDDTICNYGQCLCNT
jgi:hypothetical protein